jgi:hypothetical protein
MLVFLKVERTLLAAVDLDLSLFMVIDAASYSSLPTWNISMHPYEPATAKYDELSIVVMALTCLCVLMEKSECDVTSFSMSLVDHMFIEQSALLPVMNS